MKKQRVLLAVVAFALGSGSLWSLRADDAKKADDDDKVTDIGKAIAPVPLTFRAKDKKKVYRGSYIVNAQGGCNDCHTPSYFFGKPDMARFLGGSEVGFELPGLGVFYGPNLTPDKATGLGDWTDAEIKAAITQGKRKDGTPLKGPMGYQYYANMTDADLDAVIAYVRALPAKE